jgi:hypothetical protein
MLDGNEPGPWRGLRDRDRCTKRGAIKKNGPGDIAHAPKAPAGLGVLGEAVGAVKIAAEAGALPNPRRADLTNDVVPTKPDREEFEAALEAQLEAHPASPLKAAQFNFAFTAALALLKSICPA